MWIYENIELIYFRYVENVDREVEPVIIVDSRTGMLDGLPYEDVSYSIITPFFDTAELNIGVLQEWPSNE